MAGMQTYEDAFFYVNGKLIGDPKFEVKAADRHLSFEVPADMPDPHVEMRCRCIPSLAGLFGVDRRYPSPPAGVVTLSLPWGILGTIKVPAGITGAGPAETTEDGRARMTMNGAMDEREMRRVIANAVRRAIVTMRGADGSYIPVQAMIHGATPRVREMGHKIGPGRGCAYPGKRKRQNAMRRLLRAAGITRPAS